MKHPLNNEVMSLIQKYKELLYKDIFNGIKHSTINPIQNIENSILNSIQHNNYH